MKEDIYDTSDLYKDRNFKRYFVSGFFVDYDSDGETTIIPHNTQVRGNLRNMTDIRKAEKEILRRVNEQKLRNLTIILTGTGDMQTTMRVGYNPHDDFTITEFKEW